jgi:hypothetical protein
MKLDVSNMSTQVKFLILPLTKIAVMFSDKKEIMASGWQTYKKCIDNYL